MKEDIEKTNDVEITENVSFRDMMMSDQVLAGLIKCNFEKPSPIQLRAIPIGRCGLDLIMQSKSGTGKTLVFCTIILERYDPEINKPQSLIVVPTREIALQVENYLNSIGSHCRGFSVASVIGGRDIIEDRKRINKCKSIVGTPGRILHLIKSNYVCMQNIETFVLDEADNLVSDDFYGDINKVLNALNKNRQIIASSATYANGLDKMIVSFMHNPIAVSTSRDTQVLVGVKQFILPVDVFDVPKSVKNSTPSIQAMWRKVSAIEYILKTTSFKQCILFSNSQFRATSFANYFRQNQWNVEIILGSHDQETRTATLHRFRQYKCRILITSDLMARGVDIVNVNLVMNLDVPSDSSTYLHRIGRCGRFGRRGLAITLVSDEGEMNKFKNLLGIIGGSKVKISTFPINLNGGAKFDAWNTRKHSESGDPNVFGFGNGDENASTEFNVKQIKTNEEQKSNDEMEEDSVEQKNLNLLEVTKLLIDFNSQSAESVLNVDEDLFSSYQNSNLTDCTHSEIPLSADLFNDFAQFQLNRSDEVSKPQNTSDKEEEEEEEEEEEKEEEEEEEEGEDGGDEEEGEKVILNNQPNLYHFQGHQKAQQSEIKRHSPEDYVRATLSSKTKGMTEKKKTSNITKNTESHKNQTMYVNTQQNNLRSSMAHSFWMQTYWQQLSDINKYLLNSHYRYK